MRGEDLLALCKDALAKAGVADVELCGRWARRGCARFSVGELAQHMETDEPSLIARVARGRRIAETQTSVLDLEAIVRTIRDADDRAPHVPETEGFPGFAGEGPPTPDLPRVAKSTQEATAETRAELLAPAMDRVADAGLLSAGMLETTTASACVATTAGCGRFHDSTVASFRIWALETPGAGGAAGFGHHVHKDVHALAIADRAERAVRFAKLGKDPAPIDAGSYDVVLEPAAVAELMEWLSMTTFGAAEVEQGTSAIAGRMNERISGVAIDIAEDPLDTSELGFGLPFDREGTPRERVALVDRGIARGVLHDRTSAVRAKARSTGSAAPAGVGTTGPAACAIHMNAGDAASTEELVRGMKHGLWICRLHYVNGLVDTRRTIMTGLTRDGCFLVEDGKIVRPVLNLRFTDSFLEALARCDGMTRERAAVLTWWSEAGSTVVPAIRLRGLRFNAGSARPAVD
jgi:predicted Zn-dependent protease